MLYGNLNINLLQRSRLIKIDNIKNCLGPYKKNKKCQG